ncbi:hypothetical protein BBP40_001496 [Aspergillus hancockii]|nr:hypothetical protein BBP40_001496 [Aspergillus hancockii]
MSTTPVAPATKESNVALVPKNFTRQADLEAIITQYKALRLRGLKEDPDAFSSRYEDEFQFPDEKWRARVQNPQARTFVALDLDPDKELGRHTCTKDPLPLLLSREWLGTAAVIGPRILPEDDEALSRAPWDVFLPLDEPVPTKQELRNSTVIYMLGGMFVLATGRRQGNGRRLIEQAVNEVRAGAVEAGASRVLVVSIADRKNNAARRLYESCSFDVWDGELVLQVPREHECVAMVLELRL